jgi:hypothetical protein
MHAFQEIRRHTVRMAPTNSPGAQFGRMVIVLSILACGFMKCIFTAITIPFTAAELDSILLDVAEEDADKERLCRAILLSKLSDYRDREETIKQASGEYIGLAGQLLPEKEYQAFHSGVSKAMLDAANQWEYARKSKKKVFATLGYDDYSEEVFPDFWTDVPELASKHQGNTKHVDVTDSEDADEVSYIIFPAIIVLEKDYEAVLPGVVVRNSHMSAVEKDWQAEKKVVKKSRRFSRTGDAQ